MDERDDFDRDDGVTGPPRAPGAPGEGVRIIGAEEAAAAVESGQASPRKADDEPKYGDVPPRPPSDVRPTARFPLPESVDPTSVPRPAPSGKIRFPLPEDSGDAGDPSTGSTQLPHWTEPPTGEVPRILADQGDEDAAWQPASQAPRWRDSQADWDEPDFDELSAFDDDELRVGALDQNRGDMFSFDEPEEPELDEAPAPPRPPRGGPTRVRARRTVVQEEVLAGPVTPAGGGDRNLPAAIATGVLIAGAALVLAGLGPGWLMVLVTLVVLLSAIELFDVFRRAGYRPAVPLALTATAALVVSAYTKGERALPLVLALTVVFTFLWFLSGAVRARPTVNLGVTLLGFMWIGFLGSFAGLLLRYPDRQGVAFLLGAIVATVFNDVGALIVGRRFGSSPLAPTISPNKSWEGFAGGALASVTASVLFLGVIPGLAPWTVGSALMLGLVVSVVAPLGDLCESMVKRDLGVKDMGSLLPGHGGALDRFDALLFVLPAVYYLVELLNLAS